MSETTFIISYDANGGNGAPYAQIKNQDVDITISLTQPTRQDHVFLGWATSPEKVPTYQPGSAYVANASITLYAIWKHIPSIFQKYKAYINVDGVVKPYKVVTQVAGSYKSYKPVINYMDVSRNIVGVLSSASQKSGLIFKNDEPYDLYLELRKSDLTAENFSLRITVTDFSGNPVKEILESVDLPETESVSIPIDLQDVSDYGTFVLLVTAINTDREFQQLKFPFCRCRSTAVPGDVQVFNMNLHFTTNTGSADTKLSLSANAGASMWRSSIPWVSVETQQGSYSMPAAVDEVMATTESLGMEPLIILAYGNDGLYGPPNPTNPTWLSAYANYCRYIAEYFGDQVTYYEIWNEWNHATMSKVPVEYRTGENYAKVVVAASEAIKSVNPDAKIIGGAVAGDGYDSTNVTTFMNAMLNYDGFIDAIDGFSFHTYATDWESNFASPEQHNYPARFNYIRDLLNNRGGSSKEIWLTETGWSTCTGVGVTENYQAYYLVQLYTWALANSDKVNRIFWYDFMNDGTDASVRSDNWGLVSNWNPLIESVPYSAKMSYPAACAMSSILSGATFNGIPNIGEDILAYRFRKGNKDILVMWTKNIAKTLNINFEGTINISDICGNSTSYTGSAELNLNRCPTYLECNTGTRITLA